MGENESRERQNSRVKILKEPFILFFWVLQGEKKVFIDHNNNFGMEAHKGKMANGMMSWRCIRNDDDDGSDADKDDNDHDENEDNNNDDDDQDNEDDDNDHYEIKHDNENNSNEDDDDGNFDDDDGGDDDKCYFCFFL